jgi:septum formation protein
MTASSKRFILASSSIYRRDLLKRIINNFECISPDIDESQKINENAKEMAIRLSVEKAKKISSKIEGDNLVVIGCDQTAFCDNYLLQKPITFEKAFEQLQFIRGKSVEFFSAFCLINKERKKMYSEVVQFSALYRNFNDDEISNYLQIDKPYNCVGSIKSESYGITMLESIESDDPTAIIGLPLIKLSKILSSEKLL